jgi:NADH-ubiquinone oxidoreductase chain 5
MMVGAGTPFFGTAIHTNIQNLNLFDAEFIPLFYKTLPVNLSLFGFFSAFVFYNFYPHILYSIKVSFIGKKTYNFLNRKWLFDKMYNDCLGQFFFKFGYSVSYKFVDRGILEILGPTGLSTVVLNAASNLHRLQSGYLYHYTLIILVGVIGFISLREVWLFFGFLFDYRLLAIVPALFFFLMSSID